MEQPVEFLLKKKSGPASSFPIEEDGRGTFIMNAKDMNMLAHLRALADAGVIPSRSRVATRRRSYVAIWLWALIAAYLTAKRLMRWLTSFCRLPPPLRHGLTSEAEQAPAYDGYEQETMQIADIVADDPHYLTSCVAIKPREGDELEVLAPHEPSRRLIVRDLHWLNTFGPDSHDETPPPRWKRPSPAPPRLGSRRRVANRPATYRILVEGGARAVVPLPLTCPRVPSSANAPSAAPPARQNFSRSPLATL